MAALYDVPLKGSFLHPTASTKIGKMWHIRSTVRVCLPHGLLFRFGNGKEMAQSIAQNFGAVSIHRVRIHPSGLIWFLFFLLSSHLFSF